MREQFRSRADGRGCQRFDAHRAPRHILSSIHIRVEQKTGKISDGGAFVIALLFEFEIGFFSTFLRHNKNDNERTSGRSTCS